MKIETHLSPNCSEATFTIVNWKSKQILDTFEMQSDSGGTNEGWFIAAIDSYARKKNVEIVESKNDGNSYHPDIVSAIQKFVKQKKTLVLSEEAMNELLAGDGDPDEMVARCYMTNAELLAKGYIKKQEVK